MATDDLVTQGARGSAAMTEAKDAILPLLEFPL